MSSGDQAPLAARTVTWRGERLVAYAARGLYWPAGRTLFIADTHFGKDAAFRHAGVPIPNVILRQDLDRLSRVLAESGAERLVVLGDFFHAPEGCSEETLAVLVRWRQGLKSIDCFMVRGNHDRWCAEPPADLGLTVVEPGSVVGPFECHHEPVPASAQGERRILCGHVHPAVRFHGGGGSVQFPCFWLSSGQSLLPAFGSFTGNAVIRPRPGDRVLVLLREEIHEVVAPLQGSRELRRI